MSSDDIAHRQVAIETSKCLLNEGEEEEEEEEEEALTK